MVKQYFKKCRTCGKQFVTFNSRKQLCEICGDKNEIKRSRHEQSKKRKEKNPPREKPTKRKNGLDAKLRELRAYNEEHGTRYSYGEWVMIQKGVLKA